MAALDRSQALVEFGLDATILTANDNFLKIFRYVQEEVCGQHHSVFVDPVERAPLTYLAFWRSLQAREFDSPLHEGTKEDGMAFDWHSDRIVRETPITSSYRSTQNVRRFFVDQCGPRFKFDRPFMAWLKQAVGKTMGDAATEWLRRAGNHPEGRPRK